MVKELREKTGAGMMDCKTALTETDGDIEAAIDWLRKKGLSKAAKKAGRVAAEGLVAVAVAANLGVVVEVNSETDFVARNDDFQALVRGVLAVALDHAPTSTRRRCSARIIRAAARSTEAIANAIATIGENMTLRRAQGLQVTEGAIGHYVHGAGRRRPRQDRRDRRARIRPAIATSSPRSAARSPCMSPPPARSRSTPPASIRRRFEREKRGPAPRRTPASRRTCSRRSSRAA